MEEIMELKNPMEVKNGEFAVHLLNERGIEKAKLIQAAFDLCLNTLKGLCSEGSCSEGRYMSLVRTKLEEASFFAKKAMAIDLRNQQLDS